jgi:hypothetical protein
MTDKSVQRALSALVTMMSLIGGGTAAFASPVYLTCTCDTGPPSARRYISVDYATNEIITSDYNSIAPYGTVRNVSIDASQIAWQVVGTAWANGLYYAEHYTLSRLTGSLSYYDDGTQHGEAWTCQAGEKPAPKF